MKYRGWFGKQAKEHCPHVDLRGIYGDMINSCGGWRLWCGDCERFIDGPVKLAERRVPRCNKCAHDAHAGVCQNTAVLDACGCVPW